MMIECLDCFPEKNMTRHRVKYQAGEKESYYQIRCSRCGKERMVASYRMSELKELEKEYYDVR